MINKLKLTNFGLFKNVELILDKINLITGVNYADAEQSSNGSGKSTILNAIIFALYGEGCGINLGDLIHFGEKETIVEIEIDNFRIVRKIPASLQIYRDSKEIQFNTQTLKQQYLNEQFKDLDYFKKFRLIDRKGINILDLGIVSLRKILMEFINLQFIEVRQRLLDKKNEREKYNISKKLFKHYLSTKRKCLLESGLKQIADNKKELQQLIRETQQGIAKVNGEIHSKERIIDYKNNEVKKAEQGICPILKSSCSRIGKQMTEQDKDRLSQEVVQLTHEIEQAKQSTEGDNDYLAELEMKLQEQEELYNRINNHLFRLNSAFQFSEYKYTERDVKLYDSAIKVLDSFSGWYIQKWLDNLAIIINNLLQQVNLEVTFSADKDFITIKNENQILKYEQLSSGQKVFLNSVFKLAILLNNQETNGIILIDEGIGNLDQINLNKFIKICQTLSFQIFLIYQNIKEVENVNIINVERKANESRIA